jgi:hypothetical protein
MYLPNNVTEDTSFCGTVTVNCSQNKQNPWPLVRKRTITTERPPLVCELYFQLLRIEGCRVVSATDPHVVNLNFLDWSRYFPFK